MHDVGVALDEHLLGDLDGADLGDAADVVAAEIEQHQMLGALLRIGQQVGGERLVLGRRCAAPARAGDRADGDLAVAQPHQDLRARADDREAAEIEEEQEGRGVEPAQRAVEGEGRQLEGQLEALGRHDLEDVAGEDVFLGPLDHGVILAAAACWRRARAAAMPSAPGASCCGRLRSNAVDRVGQPLAGLVVGGARVDARLRPAPGVTTVTMSSTLSKMAMTVGRRKSASGRPSGSGFSFGRRSISRTMS